MSGSRDPRGGVPATCRHGAPGCIGPDGFDATSDRYHYVCRQCVGEATGRCSGGSC